MEIEKIKEMLEYRFSLTPVYPKKRHIIFWYDNDRAFKDVMEELRLENIKIIILTKEMNKKGEMIDTNIFKTKYTLEIADIESNYLIYSEYPKPKDNENYLLDIEFYSEFFEADKSAMIIEELKLDRTDYKLSKIIKDHLEFFASKERKEKLKKVINDIDNMNENKLKMSILASISGSKSIEILEILKNLIINKNKLEIVEKWMGLKYLYNQIKKKFDIDVNNFKQFLKILLVVHFYRGIQQKPHINLEKYYIGKTNEIYLFVESLLQNNQINKMIKEEFYNLSLEINIKDRIDELELESSVQGIGIEYFDQIVIKDIVERLTLGFKEFDIYQKYIEIRLDNSLWREKYFYFYKALFAAINILRLKETVTVKERSNINEVFIDYTSEYYMIDKYYREFYYSYDNGKNNELYGILDELEDRIAYFYEKEYLEILLEIWSNHISEREKLPQQKNFYKEHITKADTRVAVIISDALRFEVGNEIAKKLMKEANTKEIILNSMITELPSITSIGMANLLPFGSQKKIDLIEKKIFIKNINTLNTENREKILKLSCGESVAITFDRFKNKSRGEQEEYIKGKKVIYIYHDNIDAIGDKGKTENRAFEACHITIEDITGLSKTLSSLGIVNIYITSDHGFLYERKEIAEYDKIELSNQEYFSIGKRYALYSNYVEEKGCITLNVNDIYGIFPIKNQRIKSFGNGLQFVHGGISPQEMIVPLIHYKSGANSKKSSKVKIRIKESVGKITSNLTKFTIYQLEPVSIKEKIIERDIVAALYTELGIKVSDEFKVRLNATEENFQYNFRLTLSGEYKKVFLKISDIESGDILDSKEYNVNLGIASDFDF